MRKMMRALGSVVGVSALAFGSVACSIDVSGQGIVAKEEKRFTVTGAPNLDLRTFDGSIQLKSWNRNEVLIEIERRGPDAKTAEALVVNATQDGDRIVVEAPGPKDRENRIHIGPWQSPSVSLIVTAPRKLTVELRTGDGSIQVDDLAGTLALNTGDGSIEARRIEGNLRARTGDGSIRIDGAAGSVEADSGDGSIEVSGRLERVDVRTGDGTVRLDAFNGSVLKTDWSVTTGDGSITVRLPGNLDAEIDGSTGDGRVHASGLEGVTVENEEERGSLRGRIGKGGPTLRLRSGDGSIDVSR